MKENEKLAMISTARKRAQITGGILLACIILVGVAGWIYWKWYAFVIAVAAGFLFNFIYSLWQVKRISRLTGLSVEEQERLLKRRIPS